ncbi:Ig-like domain-containing protein [Bhargavaea massiliensis]|uniref:Ig-like domain-containing protein n=1 Tax=Bhargavaea massiliensis TaxID=2697500 RepID=UPI001BD0FBE0|nr:Ig-like domain-containing protein [Bhargavaea massiliensis]
MKSFDFKKKMGAKQQTTFRRTRRVVASSALVTVIGVGTSMPVDATETTKTAEIMHQDEQTTEATVAEKSESITLDENTDFVDEMEDVLLDEPNDKEAEDMETKEEELEADGENDIEAIESTIVTPNEEKINEQLTEAVVADKDNVTDEHSEEADKEFKVDEFSHSNAQLLDKPDVANHLLTDQTTFIAGWAKKGASVYLKANDQVIEAEVTSGYFEFRLNEPFPKDTVVEIYQTIDGTSSEAVQYIVEKDTTEYLPAPTINPFTMKDEYIKGTGTPGKTIGLVINGSYERWYGIDENGIFEIKNIFPFGTQLRFFEAHKADEYDGISSYVDLRVLGEKNGNIKKPKVVESVISETTTVINGSGVEGATVYALVNSEVVGHTKIGDIETEEKESIQMMFMAFASISNQSDSDLVEYTLKLDNERLQGGSTIELFQVDTEGNQSESTFVQVAMEATGEEILVPPTVNDVKENSGEITGGGAVPGGYLTVRDGKGNHAIAIADKNGDFVIDLGNLELTADHTITIEQVDSDGNYSKIVVIEVQKNAEPEDSVEQPEEPTTPGDGEEQPGEPTEPGDEEEQPGEPVEPGDGEEQPGEPTEPGDGEEQPGEPTEPGDGEEQPGDPTEPGGEEEQPGDPTEPGGEEEQPGDPTEPDGEEEQPDDPTIPGDGAEQPEESTNPGDEEEQPEESTKTDESDEETVHKDEDGKKESGNSTTDEDQSEDVNSSTNQSATNGGSKENFSVNEESGEANGKKLPKTATLVGGVGAAGAGAILLGLIARLFGRQKNTKKSNIG